MKYGWVIALLVLVAGLASAGGQLELVEPTDAGDGFKRVEVEGVIVDWRVNGETIAVRMEAPTTGWVSIGFDPARIMQDANMIMVAVTDEGVQAEDHFGTGRIRHAPDTELGGSSDILSVDATEADGRTEVTFSIPLNSGDVYDRVLRPGTVHSFIVAYGKQDDDDFGSYHDYAGGFQAEL